MPAAWLTKQLSLESKKPLVSGYSRESYGALIPTDLIKLIRWYFDEVLYWSMEGNFLNKFCNKKTGQILYSSTYNYRDIEFCCYWFPNGNDKNYENQVIFGVTLSKLPKHIESLTIYYRLQCNAFNCLWKSIHTFSESQSQSHSNCIGWNPFNMKLSKCKTKNKIDFNCYINVLRIIYKSYWKRSIEASTECIESSQQITNYEWEPDINLYTKCETGKTFYSLNFGAVENYCLFIAPKGFKKEDNNNINNLMLYLRVLRLPINIKTMTICYTMKVIYNGNKVKESKSIKVGYGFNQCTKQCLINKIPNIVLLHSLSIHIKIEIQQMIDLNNKIISFQHWNKYGIIVNNNSFSKIKKLLSN